MKGRVVKKIIGIVLLLLILIWGGFELSKYRFGYFMSAPNLQEPRAYHQSLLINDNEVLVTGGLNSPRNEKLGLKSAEIYSVKKNLFKKVSDTNLPHLYHKMFKMSDGNVVIADINGIEIYDHQKKNFKLLKSKFANRYQEFNNYNFQLLPNDRLLVVGGRSECKKVFDDDLCNVNKLEIIDLHNDILVKSLNLNGTGQGLALLPDGNLLIFGGKIYDDKKEFFTDEIYHLNTKSYKLSSWGKLPVSMINPFVFKTSNDEIVLIGGKIFNGKQPFRDFEYARYKGCPNIYVINILTKSIRALAITEYLEKNEVFMDQIIDVQQISDSLYWLQLRANKKHNSIVFDIYKNELKDYGTLFMLPTMRYRSSNIKLPNEILLSGGKLFYQEISEYVIDSEPVFYAKELNKATSEGGFILDDTVILKIK